MIHIQPMQIEEYEEVYQLWLSTPGMGLNSIDDSEEGIRRYLLRNPHTCFVCRDEQQMVGVILSGHDGRRGYIYHTAVKKDHQKQGIGSQLVKHALAALQKEGISKVALVAFSKNEIGNAFWQTLGFIQREDITYRTIALVDLQRIDT